LRRPVEIEPFRCALISWRTGWPDLAEAMLLPVSEMMDLFTHQQVAEEAEHSGEGYSCSP
jgi:hypothetical protein